MYMQFFGWPEISISFPTVCLTELWTHLVDFLYLFVWRSAPLLCFWEENPPDMRIIEGGTPSAFPFSITKRVD